jgi:hypothetical protein
MAFLATSISPATSSAGGGGTFRITGTALNTTTAVTFGGTAATSITVINANLLEVVAPAHAAGAVNVVVTDGTTPTTLTAAVTYSADDAAEQLYSSLARKFRVDVNTGTSGSPVWRQIRGILDLKPGLDTNLEDDSDYDSVGWKSQAKTQLGWKLELKLARKLGLTTAAYDLGQETLRLASEAFPGTVQVRWYDRNHGPEAYSGYATVSWSPEGGDAKSLDTVTVTLDGNGVRTDISNPA